MSGFVTSDGVTLEYRVDDFRDPWRPDSGRILLLHHGFIRSMATWQTWIPALARSHRVVRFDVRGCGRSGDPGPDGDYGPARLVDDVVELLDHLHIDRVDFVGHLSGALVGQLLAVAHPERIRSLTLVAGPSVVNTDIRTRYALGDDDSLASMRRLGLGEWLRQTNAARFDPATDPEVVEWHLAEQARTPFHVAYRIHEAFRSIDVRDDLARMAAPVLLIAARGAPGAPLDEQEATRAAMPDARLVALDGRGSDLPLTQSERCASEVLRFIESLA